MSAYQIIDDGYTLEGFIEPAAGIHGGLVFTYRPMTKRALAKMERAIAKAADDEAAEVIAADAIKSQLLKWNAETTSGKTAEITPDNILNMQTMLSGALFNIIRGYRANDARPTVDPAKN